MRRWLSERHPITLMAVLIAFFISLFVGLGWMIFELDLAFSVNSYVVLAVFYMTAYCWWLLAKKQRNEVVMTITAKKVYLVTVLLMLLMLIGFLRMDITQKAFDTVYYQSQWCPGVYSTTHFKGMWMYDYVVYRGRCEREKWVREQASDYQLMTKHHSRWEEYKEPVKSDPQYDLFMLLSGAR